MSKAEPESNPASRIVARTDRSQCDDNPPEHIRDTSKFRVVIGPCRHDAHCRHDLSEGARFPPNAGLQAAEFCESQSNPGKQENPQIPSENHDYQPDRNRVAEHEPDVDAAEQQLIGDGIEIEANSRLRTRAPRDI